MKPACIIRFLSRVARAALVLAALVATADGAIRVAFTEGAVKARVAEAVRGMPEPIRFGIRAAGPARGFLSSNHV